MIYGNELPSYGLYYKAMDLATVKFGAKTSFQHHFFSRHLLILSPASLPLPRALTKSVSYLPRLTANPNYSKPHRQY